VTSLEQALWIAILAPAVAVTAVVLGVGLVTILASWLGRHEPQDELQRAAFAAARPRWSQRIVWIGVEGLWQCLAFSLQGVRALTAFRGPDLRVPAGATPVLLVAGYLENSGLMWPLARRLRAAGYHPVPLDLPSTLAPIATNVSFLCGVIERLRDEGASEVALVGHSMGGVIGRALAHHETALPLACVVTIASPHRGTHMARLGIGRSARDMRPGSAHMQAHPPSRRGEVPVHTVVGRQEDIVSPAWSALLEEGENHVLDVPAGHVAPLFLPGVAALTAGWLKAAGVRGAVAASLEPVNEAA
jgi:PGAP1-like protein